MKLHPEVKFCPGCSSSLSLKTAPQLVAQFEKKKNDTQTVTIVGGHTNKKSQGTSLF